MQQNSECNSGLSLAYSVFLFNLNDVTTVNFNNITFIVGKHFKILTNTISRLIVKEAVQSLLSMREFCLHFLYPDSEIT